MDNWLELLAMYAVLVCLACTHAICCIVLLCVAFMGCLAEVRIWNVARSEDQVRSSYKAEVDANAPGLVGYW